MLAELAMLEPAYDASGSLTSASIVVPDGEQDDVWTECGVALASYEGAQLAKLDVEISDAFRLELDEPDDLSLVSSELSDLLLAVIFYIRGLQPRPFMPIVRVLFSTPLFVREYLFDSLSSTLSEGKRDV